MTGHPAPHNEHKSGSYRNNEAGKDRRAIGSSDHTYSDADMLTARTMWAEPLKVGLPLNYHQILTGQGRVRIAQVSPLQLPPVAFASPTAGIPGIRKAKSYQIKGISALFHRPGSQKGPFGPGLLGTSPVNSLLSHYRSLQNHTNNSTNKSIITSRKQIRKAHLLGFIPR